MHISNLKTRDRLTENVYNINGIIVLPARKILLPEDIKKLHLHNVEYVNIDFRHVDEAVEVKKSSLLSIKNIQPAYTDAIHGIRKLFEQVRIEGKIDDKLINDNLEPLVVNFQKEKDVVALLIELNSKDDYTYQHSVQVGMISYYLAKWLGKNEQESYVIGKAGYLHDIGKSQIDSEILQKPSKLNDEEYAEMKKHTIYGSDIINNSFDNPLLSVAALQHHERINGTGYPYGLTGAKIYPISKIIATADIYSAMISSRTYQQKRDLLSVLKELHRLSFNELDPFVTQTFIKNMVPNFLGKTVKLKTGETGTIVLNNHTDIFNPLINVDDTFIDLSKHKEYEIETIYT